MIYVTSTGCAGAKGLSIVGNSGLIFSLAYFSVRPRPESREARMTRVAIPAPVSPQDRLLSAASIKVTTRRLAEVQLILCGPPPRASPSSAGEAQFSTVPAGALGAALKERGEVLWPFSDPSFTYGEVKHSRLHRLKEKLAQAALALPTMFSRSNSSRVTVSFWGETARASMSAILPAA